MEKNVLDVIGRASAVVGRWQNDWFSQECVSDYENEIESPIERILYVAIKAVAFVNLISFVDPIKDGEEWHVPGLYIRPQIEIQNYRADFVISHERNFQGKWEFKQILVECDSQQFHERTEQERRYEKRRDRFFAASGYTVLHFTGSEIVQNPWAVAAEILESVVTDRPSKDELLSNFEEYLD